MESVFDLPAHPLFVHGAVVLIPLLALAVLLCVVRPGWRRAMTPWLLGAGIVALGSFWMAFESGEAFDTLLKRNPNSDVDVSRHQDLAETTRLFLFGMVIALIAMFVLDRRSRRSADPGDEQPARWVSWAGALLGALATIWVIRTGHEGARLVWLGTIK